MIAFELFKLIKERFMSLNICHIIAQELGVKPLQIETTIKLLDKGNTVPFIARYRKEITGGLNDIQLRKLNSRLTYLRDLQARKDTIIKSIDEQGKLTPTLRNIITKTLSKTELEDIYLPFKPKRRTKGQIAIEAGLAPLAKQLWDYDANSTINIQDLAHEFINVEHKIKTTKDVLDNARFIIMEQLASNGQLLAKLRQSITKTANLKSIIIAGKEKDASKFKEYFAHQENINKIPSHRLLAMLRARNEGFVQLHLICDPTEDTNIKTSFCEQIIANHSHKSFTSTTIGSWQKQVIAWAWKIKLFPKLETEFISNLREKAELEAIDVFANNLKDLLMAAPAGNKITLGMDPGLRTGTKIAVIDQTGKLLDFATIYPLAPHNKVNEAEHIIVELIQKHNVDLIAIGNGTASRETNEFIASVIKNSKLSTQYITVSEAGASVYSASETATDEFPDIDVSIRGAISIARRLQDPLAELVKIDPKAIGVGQYQHDVNQTLLSKELNNVIEDCVNSVGVDVNTASSDLLIRVAGLNKSLATNIVNYRNENGKFTERTQLKNVKRLGPKSFEQCAGFLRIFNGSNHLDSSAVHPESYSLVQKIASQQNIELNALIGNNTVLNSLDISDYANDIGIYTIKDIISELKKPGRDPRPSFKTATFAAEIKEITDLSLGLILEGVVSNVTNFGAFIDIGIHQDGLVHISEMSENFVSNPRDLIKAGDIINVKVVDIDLNRNRVSLSMLLNSQPKSKTKPVAKKAKKKTEFNKSKPKKRTEKVKPLNGSLADAFANAKFR